MIAVTQDLVDSEPVMICEDHFLKLPSREFTLKIYLPFRSAVDSLLPWWLRGDRSGGGGFMSSRHFQVPLFAVYKEVASSQRLASPEALWDTSRTLGEKDSYLCKADPHAGCKGFCSLCG